MGPVDTDILSDRWFRFAADEAAAAALDDEALGSSGTALQDVLDYLFRASPAFSLRGGTREILRGIIAKGLGLR